jgi:hypothetical protein
MANGHRPTTDPVGKTDKSQIRQTDLHAYAGRVQLEMGQLKGIEDISPISTRKLLLQSGAKMRENQKINEYLKPVLC